MFFRLTLVDGLRDADALVRQNCIPDGNIRFVLLIEHKHKLSLALSIMFEYAILYGCMQTQVSKEIARSFRINI